MIRLACEFVMYLVCQNDVDLAPFIVLEMVLFAVRETCHAENCVFDG